MKIHKTFCFLCSILPHFIIFEQKHNLLSLKFGNGILFIALCRLLWNGKLWISSFSIKKKLLQTFQSKFSHFLKTLFPVFKRQATYKEQNYKKKLTTNTLSQKLTVTHTNKHLTSVVVLWNILMLCLLTKKYFIHFYVSRSHSLSFSKMCCECWFWSVWQKVFFLIIDFSIFHLYVLFLLTHHLCCCFYNQKESII